MAKQWWEYLTGGSDEGDANFSMGDLFSSDEPAYDIYDFGNLEQVLRDANARDFLRGMEETTETEGSGVAGTGILTKGTNIPTNIGKSSFSIPKFFQDKEGNFDWLKALLLAGAAYAGSKSKAPPSGGGVAYAYKGPSTRLVRTIDQGPYGPIARHTRVPINAAQGGIMQAYAQGGPVAMEDGGFVMTKKAVDGAGGPQGIQSLLPGARPIRGPGTGTSDSIPAYIQGRNGATPARVSNGEAYVPKATVQQAGGSRQLYNLMNMLQRRA